MTDRILTLIKYLNLSPSDFAEEIGVQRSSISHLISGRNKPSLEFIQKILSRFPEINTEWILTGQGEMLKSGFISEPGTIPFENGSEKEKNEMPEPLQRDPARMPARKKPVNPEGKQVEKIIYFFRDKTFREYTPE